MLSTLPWRIATASARPPRPRTPAWPEPSTAKPALAEVTGPTDLADQTVVQPEALEAVSITRSTAPASAGEIL